MAETKKCGTTLYDAITSHNLTKVKRLLAQGRDPNSAYSNPYRFGVDRVKIPLPQKQRLAFLCVANRWRDNHTFGGVNFDPELLPVILDLAFPRATTALHLAAGFSSPDIVRALLEYGARLEARDRWSFTPLCQAIQSSNFENLDLLLMAKANPNVKTSKGETPLHLVSRDDLGLSGVEPLLEHGARIDARMRNGRTPLFLALFYKQYHTLRILIEHKADMTLRYKNGDTILHLAAARCSRKDDYDNLQFLIESKAPVDLKNDKGEIALWTSIRRRDRLAGWKLLQAGACVNNPTPRMSSPYP